MFFFQIFFTNQNDKWIASAFKLKTKLFKGLDYLHFGRTKKSACHHNFFWQNYLSLQKSPIFDELQVKKASSNAREF